MKEELLKAKAELMAAMVAANFNTRDEAYKSAQFRYNRLCALKNRDPKAFK
jgi:hypothetical protein